MKGDGKSKHQRKGMTERSLAVKNVKDLSKIKAIKILSAAPSNEFFWPVFSFSAQ